MNVTTSCLTGIPSGHIFLSFEVFQFVLHVNMLLSVQIRKRDVLKRTNHSYNRMPISGLGSVEYMAQEGSIFCVVPKRIALAGKARSGALNQKSGGCQKFLQLLMT